MICARCVNIYLYTLTIAFTRPPPKHLDVHPPKPSALVSTTDTLPLQYHSYSSNSSIKHQEYAYSKLDAPFTLLPSPATRKLGPVPSLQHQQHERRQQQQQHSTPTVSHGDYPTHRRGNGRAVPTNSASADDRHPVPHCCRTTSPKKSPRRPSPVSYTHLTLPTRA